MAHFYKLKSTRNIILLVVMFCCIGSCGALLKYDSNHSVKIKEEIYNLPRLSTPEAIDKAINAPQKAFYLLENHHFNKYEYVTDPYKELSNHYIYVQCSRSKWHDEKVRKGEVVEHAGWSSAGFKELYGTLYITNEVELEGFNNAKVDTCSVFTLTCDDYKYEYKYIDAGGSYSFVAELGCQTAKLGYKGSRVLVNGDIDMLIESTTTEMNHYFIGFLLFVVVVILLILVIKDII